MPARIKIIIEKRPLSKRANIKTSPMDNMAPPNAATVTVENPTKLTCNPILMTTTAPNAAPLDTPSVNGSARGFLSKA